MNKISFRKPRKNLGGYSWLLMIDSLTKNASKNNKGECLCNMYEFLMGAVCSTIL